MENQKRTKRIFIWPDKSWVHEKDFNNILTSWKGKNVRCIMVDEHIQDCYLDKCIRYGEL